MSYLFTKLISYIFSTSSSFLYSFEL
ncbi:hypothetical protein [Arcobacter sp.]